MDALSLGRNWLFRSSPRKSPMKTPWKFYMALAHKLESSRWGFPSPAPGAFIGTPQWHRPQAVRHLSTSYITLVAAWTQFVMIRVTANGYLYMVGLVLRFSRFGPRRMAMSWHFRCWWQAGTPPVGSPRGLPWPERCRGTRSVQLEKVLQRGPPLQVLSTLIWY